MIIAFSANVKANNSSVEGFTTRMKLIRQPPMVKTPAKYGGVWILLILVYDNKVW